MHMDFKNCFKNQIAVIIDCFEVFVERPSNLLARAQSWPNYKHHNTGKSLIGIALQGYINFISNACGGRVSDKYLTKQSKVLKNLFPGDAVLADRCSNIEGIVGLYCASLKIPAFTTGKVYNYHLLLWKKIERRFMSAYTWKRVTGLVKLKVQVLQSTAMAIEFLHTKPEE